MLAHARHHFKQSPISRLGGIRNPKERVALRTDMLPRTREREGARRSNNNGTTTHNCTEASEGSAKGFSASAILFLLDMVTASGFKLEWVCAGWKAPGMCGDAERGPPPARCDDDEGTGCEVPLRLMCTTSRTAVARSFGSLYWGRANAFAMVRRGGEGG